MNSTNRKFKILGIEHVAIAVNDPGECERLFGRVLGLEDAGSEEVTEQKVNTRIYTTQNDKIELLTSTSEESPINKFLEKRGDGIHHIAFRVDDIHGAIKYLESQDIQMVDTKPRVGAEGHLIAFLHPRSTSGILIELCQKP